RGALRVAAGGRAPRRDARVAGGALSGLEARTGPRRRLPLGGGARRLVAARAVRGRLGRAGVAARVRRPRVRAGRVDDLGRGEGPGRGEPAVRRAGVRYGRADDYRARDRRAEGAVPATAAPGRRDLVSAVQRTGSGLGPRRAHLASRA